jgi:hypothetical protein
MNLKIRFIRKEGNMIEQFGGRKFVGFLFVSTLLTLLVVVDKITGSDFVAFITANFGLFVAGNAAEKIVK